PRPGPATPDPLDPPAAPRVRPAWGWCSSAQLRTVDLGDVRLAGVLAPLQGPHVGDDRPAIAHLDLRAIRLHVLLAVGDHVEDLAVGHVADALVVVVGHADHAVLRRDPLAVAGRPVADGAIDVEPFLPAAQQGHVHRHGRPGDPSLA